MKFLTIDETNFVSGGIIQNNDVPPDYQDFDFNGTTFFGNLAQLDASETVTPGNNSYNESTPGGAGFYNSVMSWAISTAQSDTYIRDLLTSQVNTCTTGNLGVCAYMTFQVFDAIANAALADANFKAGK